MKLLSFIYSLGPGGAEKVLTTLANGWAERGHEVTIATYDHGSKPFFHVSDKVKTLRLKLSGGSFPRRIFNHLARPFVFRRVMAQESPDVVISFMDKTNILVLVASPNLKIPVIISERIDPASEYSGFIVSIMRRLVYNRAYALVTLGHEQALWFSDMCKKVCVIPNPVTSPPLHVTEKRKPTVVAAGRLTHQKGFDLLLKAFANVCKDFPSWQLIIYGQGPENQKLRQLACQLNLNQQVKFGGISSDLPRIFSQAGIFVLSSRFEGFPNVLTEAMASGCPVIATNCTDSISEIVTDKKNGLLVPSEDHYAIGNAIRQLLENPELRNQLGDSARKSVTKKFSQEVILNQWETLINKAVHPKEQENFR